MESVFNLKQLEREHFPSKAFDFNLKYDNTFRANNFCVKLSNSDTFYIDSLPAYLKTFVNKVIEYCNMVEMEWEGRYIYLTVDNRKIESNASQRYSGWHIDGMQGNEVKVKTEPDFQFICTNKIPTEFARQSFSLEGFDSDRDNVFNFLGGQIDPSKVEKIECSQVYLMTPYMVHRGQISPVEVNDRIFLRISFTKTPITSVKMTINPDIKDYGYNIHTTTGNIPLHLK